MKAWKHWNHKIGLGLMAVGLLAGCGRESSSGGVSEADLSMDAKLVSAVVSDAAFEDEGESDGDDGRGAIAKVKKTTAAKKKTTVTRKRRAPAQIISKVKSSTGSASQTSAKQKKFLSSLCALAVSSRPRESDLYLVALMVSTLGRVPTSSELLALSGMSSSPLEIAAKLIASPAHLRRIYFRAFAQVTGRAPSEAQFQGWYRQAAGSGGIGADVYEKILAKALLSTRGAAAALTLAGSDAVRLRYFTELQDLYFGELRLGNAEMRAAMQGKTLAQLHAFVLTTDTYRKLWTSSLQGLSERSCGG